MMMTLLQLLVALCLLAQCAPALSQPSTAECESAFRSASQNGDAASLSTLDVCALHYRSEPFVRMLAVAHARHPSPPAAAKVQQLLTLLPSDPVLLQSAAAIYRRSGQLLWAALAKTRAAFAGDGTGSAAADERVSDAAVQWDELQQNRASRAQFKTMSNCCEEQHPSPSCSKYFAQSAAYIAM